MSWMAPLKFDLADCKHSRYKLKKLVAPMQIFLWIWQQFTLNVGHYVNLADRFFRIYRSVYNDLQKLCKDK